MEAAELRTDSGTMQRATWIVVSVLHSRYCIESSNLPLTTAERPLQIDNRRVGPPAPNLSQTLSGVCAKYADDGATHRRRRDHSPVRRQTQTAQLAFVCSDRLRDVAERLLSLAPDCDRPLLLPQHHLDRTIFPLANVAKT